MLSLLRTSQTKNLAEEPSVFTNSSPFSSFWSKTATLPPLAQISSQQALPSPDALDDGDGG